MLEKARESAALLLVGILCAAGCIGIAVGNILQVRMADAEVIPSASYHAPLTQAADEGTSSPTETAARATININTATADELAAFLPGIGKTKANRIVDYRETAGGFDSVEELLCVKGIGEKTLENIRPYCRVTDEQNDADNPPTEKGTGNHS